MTTMLEYLQGIHPLTKDLIEDLRSAIKIKEVYRMHMWLGQDDVSNALAFMEKGLFRRFSISDEGEEICDGFIKGNDWFSSGSFFDQKPNTESIQALEDSRVHYLTYKDYNRLCNQYLIINKALRIVMEEITLRVAVRISDSRLKPYERYMKFLHDTPDLLIRVPSGDLCSYLEIDEKTLQEFRYGNKKIV